MRASEFITEGEMHPWHKQGIPGLRTLDGTNQFYDLYRFGVALAGVGRDSDKTLGDKRGPTQDNPVTLSYTAEDDKIVTSALKKMGKSSSKVTSQQSAEPVDTDIKSCVANLGPVKRKS